ncbi:hypothetical protein F443_22591 [Phytophthora nicotianae P1569]|uniref:Core-binding (CB) domain-containing protein n=1 Tax=Phytophthora nicotianae P1569 TaxID=1317065 RepID=V9DVD3_PHYNI|nr:hypothetical protein F443_22591 [Phytophthora nicotianae P1569]
MSRQSLTFQELLQGGIDTATHVIKQETRSVYASYFKKFCEFCISNEYPDPAVTRHHELPSLLVAFMESVSASSAVSNQTAEKIRAAVANFYGSYERRDAAGPDKWMVMTDDRGGKYGLGNPAKDAFVRQFMRGLKKRKNKEFTQRQATPISLDMLRVLHCHLARTAGFTEASRLWFLAVSAFAFYGMCRINEVLSLQWKNLTLNPACPSTSDPTTSISYGVYKLEGRKTEVAEGRCYNLHRLGESESPMDVLDHLNKWIEYVVRRQTTNHKWSDNKYVFPAFSKIAKSVIKTDGSLTGCEKARVEWGKKMSEQSFITLLNCVVRDLNRNGTSVPGYIRRQWRDIWFTSHTFRRAGAQYRFMFAPPERRWSLRMVKWWAGWTPNESAETLVRYLLDQAATDEDTQLADCSAPDRGAHIGCPSTFQGRKRDTAVYHGQRSSNNSTTQFEKRLKTVESSVKAVEDKIDQLIAVLRPSVTPTPSPPATNCNISAVEQISILPPVRDWKDLYRMYWKADSARHLFKPVCEWTPQERKQSGVLPSRLSVVKLIAEDVLEFAVSNGVSTPLDASETTLSVHAAYYVKHWVGNTPTASLNVFTVVL